MGCFFACLGTSKHRKSKKSSNSIPSGVQKHGTLQFPEPIKQEKIENPVNPIPESKEKVEDHLSRHSKKKVTFDSNVKSEEGNVLKESAKNLVESNEEKVGEKKEETPKESESLSDSLTPTVVSYPSNHRYQNCRDSDSELEDLEIQVKELDDNDIDEAEAAIKEESSESLFSLSIESRKQVSEAETDEKEINSPMPKPVVACESKPGGLKGNARDRRQYVDSVLNSVENLSQWKTIKARAAPPVTHHAKENINRDLNIVPISLEPSFKLLAHTRKLNADHPKPVDEGIAVDASLSSWLVGLETTANSRTSTVSVGNSPSEGAKSPRRQEDRPILGALTVEELKQLSASSSPRRSPGRSPSPDEVPIIGTVGSYWSHTGQTMATGSSSSSCCQGILSTRRTYIEENRVKWNSTPFERRLERTEI